MKKSHFLFAIFCAFSAEAQDVKMLENVRGSRYCEILVVKGALTDLTATVYNTLGLNDCPPALWKSIDAARLEKELSAKTIVMNGPRYFLMDKIGQSNAAPPTVNIGGLDFKERAKLGVSVRNLLMGKTKPYRETSIQRSTEYVFQQGSVTYQLTSPLHTYVMQSYAQIVDPALTESGLDQLNARLKLPSGWKFKTVALDHDLVLKTVDSNEAHVIQDDLQNTYQRIDQ
jgi:haloalkane dehalogenase